MPEYPFIIGALLPLAISLVKRAGWSNMVKKVIAGAVSAVVAVVAYFIFQGGWNGWAPLVADAAIIYAMAQVTYLGFWEDSVVEVKLANYGV